MLIKRECRLESQMKIEKLFVKHSAPNHMPDPKREWGSAIQDTLMASLKYQNFQRGITRKKKEFVQEITSSFIVFNFHSVDSVSSP